MIGVVVGLLCATTWACGSILIRDLSRKLDPFTLNAPRALVGGLTMLAVALATGRTQYSSVNMEQLFFLLASVGVGGGIGDTFYVRSLTRIGVSRAFPVASTYPEDARLTHRLTQWRILLRLSPDQTVEPLEIRHLDVHPSQLQAFYPHHHPWQRYYKVRFPKTDAPIELLFTGPAGGFSLIWEESD